MKTTRFLLVILVLTSAACVRVDAGWTPAKAEAFHASLGECMESNGHAYLGSNVYEPVDLVSGRPEVDTYLDCYSEVLEMPEHDDIGYQNPLTELMQLRAEGFALWACIENSGYERAMGIRLSSEGGYPIAPMPIEFDVPNTVSAIEDFYSTAADCGGVSIEVFENPFGELDHGGVECLRHDHDGDTHQHNCVRIDDYPESAK